MAYSQEEKIRFLKASFHILKMVLLCAQYLEKIKCQAAKLSLFG
jgi:hypothetical protein